MSNDAHRCDPRDAAGARSNQITDEGVIRDLVEVWRTRSTLRGTRSIRSCGLKRDCILSRIKFYFKHFPSGPLLSPPPLSLPNVHQRLGQLEKLDCYFYEIRLKKDRGSYDPGLYDRLKNRGVRSVSTSARIRVGTGGGRGGRRRKELLALAQSTFLASRLCFFLVISGYPRGQARHLFASKRDVACEASHGVQQRRSLIVNRKRVLS